MTIWAMNCKKIVIKLLHQNSENFHCTLWLMETHVLGVSRPLPTLKMLQNFWFSVNNQL